MVDKFLPTISSLVALGEFAPGAPDVNGVLTGSFGSADGACSGGVSGGDPDLGANGCAAAEADTLTPQSREQQARRAESEWQGAIVAIGELLRQSLSSSSVPHSSQQSKRPKRVQRATRGDGWKGVMLSGPFPVLDFPELTTHLSNWTFIPQPLAQLSLTFAQLMPAGSDPPLENTPAARLLTLLEGDPLVMERFCLLLTQQFSLVVVLGKDANEDLHFQFSFTPQVVQSVWQLLRSRILLTQSPQLEFLDPLVEQFTPRAPDYQLVSQFSRHLLSALSEHRAQGTVMSTATAVNAHVERTTAASSGLGSTASISHSEKRTSTVEGHQGDADSREGADSGADAELLKAMAHEIRTPLTTIRTLTRSLLRRTTLDANVIKRLQQIDRECTQQIDRFGLIFKAVELEAATYKTPRSPLTATSLSEVFQSSIPQWQQAATRRNLMLEVSLPPKLPMVASDPAMLQQVLTGLVELFTHSVLPGSHIDLQVLAAGHQLKLQFQPHLEPSLDRPVCQVPTLKSLGHLLMFQPDTGGLSLNLTATKALFQALGAKLIVRERPRQGPTWTVFLPIETADYPIV